MEKDTEFEVFWEECLALAYNDRQREIMSKCKNLYYDYYNQHATPKEAMFAEWG